MARKRFYIPTIEGDLKTWITHFNKKIGEHGPTIGFTGGEINTLKTKGAQVIIKIDDAETAKNDWHEAVDDKRTTKKKNMGDITKLITRAKLHDGFSTKIGEDLDVIGEENTLDEGEAKPVLVDKKIPLGTELSFNLLNTFDGVNIYRKRPDEDDFSFLALDTRSPYVDTDEQVNGTQYYALFTDGENLEVGQQGDIITIEV